MIRSRIRRSLKRGGHLAKIFYSLSGEGRGHATRVRAMVEALREEHEVVIFAPGQAWDMLAPVYGGSPVRIERMPGLQFHYTARQRLDTLLTGWHGARYIAGLPALVGQLERAIEAEQPDLILTDFEPALPAAARRCGVPFLSLNHQNFLIVNDLGALPARLRRHAAFMSVFVRAYHWGQAATLVSSFYHPPVKARFAADGVAQIGVLLRPEIRDAAPRDDGHLVAYLRRFATPNVMEALRACGRRVKIYGLGEQARVDNLEFCAIDARRFADDLVHASALVSTAGNQLVGEALYLGKPVLAMPEPGNAEQEINGFFLNQSGAGRSLPMTELSHLVVVDFLDMLPVYRGRINREALDGTAQALRIVRGFLPESGAAEAAKPAAASVPAEATL